MSAADSLGSTVLRYIMDVAAGRFSLDEASISREEDPTLRDILGGLMMLNEELVFREQERREVERINRELSTPVLEVGHHVLLMPLVGVVDLGRSEQMTERALSAVSSKSGRVLVIDITGVANIDAGVAARLTSTVRAVALLGARSILTGVSPANARLLVSLGVELGEVLTRRTLGDGLETAYAMTRE